MHERFLSAISKREIETGCIKLSIYEACSSQFVTCNIVFKMEYELISSASSDVDSVYSDVEPSDISSIS